MKKALFIDKPLLVYPTNDHGKPVWITLWENEEILFQFYAFLNFREPKVWYYCDMTRWMGKSITLEVEMDDMTQEEFDTLVCADSFPGYADIYDDPKRPQLQFTFKRGVLNDPNALFYVDGVYHMFVQHQPYTNEYGDWQELCNFGWGHAISKDLLHWTELPDEFIPDEFGPAFSGNGVIDANNVSGLQQGDIPPILIYYTAAGGKGRRTMHLKHTQCMAYSVDGGKSFQKYAGNPIVPNFYPGNRDPKVLYHEESGKWLMVIFEDYDANKYLVLTSDDLFHFELVSEIEFGERECPNLFELEVEGENRKQLMFSGVRGLYMAVSFDGKDIKPLSPRKSISAAGIYQAMQLMELPDGRKLSFYCTPVLGDGFNKCVGIPNEIKLFHEQDEYILHMWPMREFDGLCVQRDVYSEITFPKSQEGMRIPAYELMDIDLHAEVTEALMLNIHGVEVLVDARQGVLEVKAGEQQVASVTLNKMGKCHLRLISDHQMLCVYEEYNHIVMPLQVKQCYSEDLLIQGASVTVNSMEIRKLKSIWEKPSHEGVE